jgi:hypothetical protein
VLGGFQWNRLMSGAAIATVKLLGPAPPNAADSTKAQTTHPTPQLSRIVKIVWQPWSRSRRYSSIEPVRWTVFPQGKRLRECTGTVLQSTLIEHDIAASEIPSLIKSSTDW